MKKTIKIFSLILLATVVFYSCNDKDLNVTNNSAGFETGGLIRNDSKLVNYVIGSGATYNFDLLVYQGDVKTTSIDVYKSFTSAAGVRSNEVLLKTVPVTSSITSSMIISTDFNELIQDLVIGGQPLTNNDANLVIADFWTLRYVAKTSKGEAHSNGVTSKLAVSTRLAGNYTVLSGRYLHPVGEQGNFRGLTRIIESVANEPAFATYKATDIGPWTSDLNFFYFTVSNVAAADGTYPITVLKTWDGNVQLIWGADDIAVCQNGEAPDMSCRNYAEFAADGHDKLYYSYGYIRASGTRQFDEELIKQ